MPLTPHIPDGGRQLAFDFPAIEVGVAEYPEGPTGCTVFNFNGGMVFHADVRGGAVGTINADHGYAHAFCFSGGSLPGQEATAGVTAELLARRKEQHVGWADVPLVAGAIIFDYGGRTNAIHPDRELGAAAWRARRAGVFPLGARGAGRNASVGKLGGHAGREAAGQGAAFRQVGHTKVAVFTVVNAVGAIHDRDGRVVRGFLDPARGARRSALRHVGLDTMANTVDAEWRGRGDAPAPAPGENTTLTLVVTNQQLDSRGLMQFARQTHGSMNRAIQPFHTPLDGDILFAATTNEVSRGPLAQPAVLGVLAAEVAWDAVLSCWDA